MPPTSIEDGKEIRNAREYNATSSSLTTSDYYERTISKNTVLGILCRCVGDPRKLYAAQQSDDYFFRDIDQPSDGIFSIDVQYENINDEVVLLSNTAGRNGQGIGGIIRDDSLIGQGIDSIHAKFAWAPLFASTEDLLYYLTSDNLFESKEDLNAMMLTRRVIKVNEFEKENASDRQMEVISKIRQPLKERGFDAFLIEKEGKPTKIDHTMLRCIALREQIKRMRERDFDFEDSSVLSPQGHLPGINPKGITLKDFVYRATGEKQLQKGNPFMFKKGDSRGLKVSSGTIFVNLNVPTERAVEIKNAIENAAVSNFPVGKKGLGYIKRIII